MLHALVKRGHTVLLPFGQSRPFDFVMHLQGVDFLRVQCKSARSDRGCALFNGFATDHVAGLVEDENRGQGACPSSVSGRHGGLR